MKTRLFALATFALLVLSGAWSHSAQSRCDASAAAPTPLEIIGG